MRYIELGGPLMWPLLACSIALGAVTLERLWVLTTARLFGRRLSPSVRDWHRRALPFFVDIPPSLGLLGTVLGIVRSFDLSGGIDASGVGAGMGVACMTTVFGLSIAIWASLLRYLSDWLARLDPSSGTLIHGEAT
ncbi:MAG: MotA/TolQ/ExbB proton channel family protein [Planctomycetota bacterium]